MSPDLSALVAPCHHGTSPFRCTEIDFVLRDLGVTSIVGVSGAGEAVS